VIRLDWEQKLENSSKLVVEELQPLFEQETKVTTRDVYVMHGRAAILSKAVEMLESTKEEVLLSIPGLDLDIEDLAAVAENVLAVKAHTRILTSSVPDSVKPLIPSNFEVRTRERVFGVGLVVDERQTLIMLAGGNSDTEFLGIYSSASLFASMARAYFESLWTDSSPL
jgi:sugar-specific transcriptional regulator TrmB